MDLEKVQGFLKKQAFPCVLLLLLLPLFFINVSAYHDWGDDFAQYLDQTKLFLSGEQHIHLAVVNYEDICPSHRGSGFSLLISPVYHFFGHDMQAFLLFISFFAVATALLVFYFFTIELGEIVVKNKLLYVLMTLALFYNYHVLNLKMLVLPVFVFSFFLYLVFLLYRTHEKSMRHFLILAVLTGILISIRNLGWCLYLSILVYFVLENRKNLVKSTLLSIAIILLVPWIVSSCITLLVVGQLNYQNVLWYESVFSFSQIYTTIMHNLTVYFNTLQFFFEQEVWGWLNVVIKSAVFFLFVLGLWKKFYERVQLYDVFFIVYLTVLLLYPYDGASYRFFFPVLPIVLLYVYYGIQAVQLPFSRSYFALSFFTLLLLSNYIRVQDIVKNPNSTEIGPESQEAKDAFAYLNKKFDASTRIAFCKPSALHYYSNRKAVFTEITNTPEETMHFMKKHDCSLLLLCTDKTERGVCNPGLVNYVYSHSNFEEIWKNTKFALFQWK